MIYTFFLVLSPHAAAQRLVREMWRGARSNLGVEKKPGVECVIALGLARSANLISYNEAVLGIFWCGLTSSLTAFNEL